MIRSIPAPRLMSFLIPVVAAGAMLSAAAAAAEVKPDALIGDHMVVQRGKAVHLWGTASAGKSVTASTAGAESVTKADAAGKWSLTFAALPAGGPYSLILRGANTLTFTDIWSGEVWVASGQSNMEFPLSR